MAENKEQFRERLITNWEKAYDRGHKGYIEIDKNTNIVVWDNDFVENLLTYAFQLSDKVDAAEFEATKVLGLLKK